MGLLDIFKKKNQPKPKGNNTTLDSSSLYPSYWNALRLTRSNEIEHQRSGHLMMRHLAEKENDARACMWLATEFESHSAFRAAAQWYEKAAQLGVAEAKEGYSRCNNPYHIDHDYVLPGERIACGTFHARYEGEMEDKQRRDFASAMTKLDQNPAENETVKCVDTILQIASANRCVVPEAQIWMGNFVETVMQNLDGAAYWFKKAADNNSPEGARCYADLLISGRGVKKDIAEAMKYYQIAADQGHAEAQFVIAQHLKSQGMDEEAQEFFQRSADGGYAPAKEYLSNQQDEEISDDTIPHYILSAVFRKIVSNNSLDDNGLLEYYTEIYQPDDFCQKALAYCRDHYAAEGPQKMAFEYCMTAFYGCICSVALWKENAVPYKANPSVWDVLYSQIDVEFTDSNAERLLGTKLGEARAENIFALISEYFGIVKYMMLDTVLDEEFCLVAMNYAYRLGMLVAKRELNIAGADFTREYIVSNTADECHDDTPEKKAEIKNEHAFYSDCITAFHEEAAKHGFAKRGLIFIPELIPMGEKLILAFLRDEFFASQFGNNPTQYYYVIMSLAFQAGLCFGDKWHTDFARLKSGYVDEIIRVGPADDANEILENILGISGIDEQNTFYQKIYVKWVEAHELYWALSDPRAYTFKAMVAAYQLGISMVLEKYGF